MKRNIKRFPKDFMFQLTQKEKDEVIANCDNLRNLKFSPHLPYVFTEHGAVMLASVLNSDRAIKVNIQIVKIFIQMRELILSHKDVLLKLEQLEKQTIKNSKDVQLIFKYLKKLFTPEKQIQRKQIGYKREG
jgi:hypothetical protein